MKIQDFTTFAGRRQGTTRGKWRMEPLRKKETSEKEREHERHGISECGGGGDDSRRRESPGIRAGAEGTREGQGDQSRESGGKSEGRRNFKVLNFTDLPNAGAAYGWRFGGIIDAC